MIIPKKARNMNDMEQLAQRAVDCKGWRWMDGMAFRLTEGAPKRCILTSKKGWPIYRDGYGRLEEVPSAKPDLSDPATLGCLLALTEAAWEEAVYLTRCRLDELWCATILTMADAKTLTFAGRLKAEALVCALEAAGGIGTCDNLTQLELEE